MKPSDSSRSTVLLEDGERELGERLADQVVDAGLEHVGHRAESVAVEALASPDADGHDPVVAAPVGAGADDVAVAGSGGKPSCVRTWSADWRTACAASAGGSSAR